MSSKVIKKQLTNSRDRGDRILAILNGKRGAVDVTEFVTTIKFVNNVIDDFLKTKSKERPTISLEAENIDFFTKDYEDLLNQLVNTQRFLRFFTSNRVKKKLDQTNTQLFKEASSIAYALQEKRRASNKKGTPGPVKRAVPLLPELERLTDCFRDEDAKRMWEIAFEQSLMVRWGDFITALQQVLPMDEEGAKQLQYVLDNSNTGYIGVYKFSDFLNGFGPLAQCVEKVKAVLNAEWFHGFLSSTEAERLLERQSPGTFLIRFSKSRPGSFAIAYVDASQRNTTTHTLITCCPPSGFKIEEAYNRNARGRLFVTLNEVVEFYNYLLKTSFRSDLSRLSWFHGDLTSQEAEEILSTEKDGTYLVRFSSKPGCLAISYVYSKEVKHGLLEALQNGYRYDNQPPIYNTLGDVAANLSEILKHPLTNLTFDVGKTVGMSSTGTLPSPLSRGMTGEARPPADSTYADFSKILKNPVAVPSPVAARPPPVMPSGPSAYGSSQVPTGSVPIATPSSGSSSSPLAGSPNSQYGSMPRAFSPGEANIPYNAQTLRDAKTGPQPSTYANIPSTFKGLVTPQSTPGSEYGGMPTADANSGYTNVNGNGPTPVAASQYGTISVNMLSRPTSEYGGMPSQNSPYEGLSASSPPVPRQSLPTSTPPNYASIKTSLTSEYGGMPTQAEAEKAMRTPAPPSSQYGTISLKSLQLESEYGAMPSEPSPTATNNPPSSPSPAPSSQYGTIPSPLANRTTSIPSRPNSQPTSTANSNYGSIPVPGSPLIPRAAPAPPVGLPLSNYGNIGNNSTTPTPTPTATSTPTPTPATNKLTGSPSRGTTPTSSNNYGDIPKLNLRAKSSMFSQAPPSPEIKGSPKPFVPPASPPPSQNYGSIPRGLSQPMSPPSPTPAQSNYGSIPQVIPKRPFGPLGRSGSSVANQVAQPPPSGLKSRPQSEYGNISTPPSLLNPPQTENKITSSTSNEYGVLPSPSAISGEYGAFPSVAPSSTGSEYGALPSASTSEYGSLPSASNGSEYGSLPSLHNTGRDYDVIPVATSSEYGSLPTGAETPSEYGSLPSSEYGSLPSGDQSGSEYGALPSATSEYDSLPQPLPNSNSEYGALPSPF